LRQSVLPEFPAAVMAEGITSGWARVVIDVDPEGVPTDSLVVGYTRSEFGVAAARAVRKWQFDPMIVEGRPVASQVAVAFDYEAKGVVLNITPASDLLRLWLKTSADRVYQPCNLKELDAIPVPLTSVEPIYPLEFESRGITGTATVEFYIDETGAVRMPAVVKADYPELGHLLADAVRQWTFAPPTRQGRPVLVHASQTVMFGKSQ
jgi:TonB family protein